MEKENQIDETVVPGEATATETPLDDVDTVVRMWFCPVWHVPPFCSGVGCARCHLGPPACDHPSSLHHL